MLLQLLLTELLVASATSDGSVNGPPGIAIVPRVSESYYDGWNDGVFTILRNTSSTRLLNDGDDVDVRTPLCPVPCCGTHMNGRATGDDPARLESDQLLHPRT